MTDILVIDDEEAIRKLLRKFLEIKGYTCELAVNAAHAREFGLRIPGAQYRCRQTCSDPYEIPTTSKYITNKCLLAQSSKE